MYYFFDSLICVLMRNVILCAMNDVVVCSVGPFSLILFILNWYNIELKAL